VCEREIERERERERERRKLGMIALGGRREKRRRLWMILITGLTGNLSVICLGRAGLKEGADVVVGE
jgi:hypothetical protein